MKVGHEMNIGVIPHRTPTIVSNRNDILASIDGKVLHVEPS